MSPEFQAWPKIARLNRGMVMTEKIDGTNAAIGVTEDGEVYAQSRTRLITPEDDNFGFAAWVRDRAEAARVLLGPGIHYGEWWGKGIQRGYDQITRRFSMFNVSRWQAAVEGNSAFAEFGFEVVPTIYAGYFNTVTIDNAVEYMRDLGSHVVPGYMKPEGVVIYLPAARQLFKVTLEGDEKPKGQTE